MASGRTNAGGTGSVGTLTITGVAGEDISVSNGEKTYTRTANSDGKAFFSGLGHGTWSEKMTGAGTKKAEKKIFIKTEYEDYLKYFTATIAVTCPEGSHLTCTHTDGTQITADPDGTSYTFTVDRAGEWTVAGTLGNLSNEQIVTISTDGQAASVTISYFSAYIAVTYPSGSTCSISDGSTMLTAPDTSGTWTAIVPNPGEWTVTATDGSQSKSETVTVSESDNGKTKSVTLTYELVLFDNGSYAEETGGWSGISGKKLTAAVSGVASGGEGFGAFYTKNKIDLSGFNTLHFTIASKAGDEDYDSYFGASNYQSASSGNYSSYAAKSTFKNSAVGQTLTVDISSINADHYIRGTVHAWGSGAYSNFSVSKVWLT